MDRLGARRADGRETGIGADIHRVLPAALAFVARGALHFNAELSPAARSSSTWDTINSPGNSAAYCSSKVYSSPLAERRTRASSGAPISFSLRAVSRLFSTTSLTCIRRSQLAARFRTPSSSPADSSAGLRKVRHMNAIRASHVAPDLFGGEAHQGRQQAHEGVQQPVERGLRAAPRLRFRRRGVEPVLQHIEVHRAQVHRAEGVDRVIDLVELEVVVPGAAAGHQVLGAQQDPLVELRHLAGRHRIVCGSKSARLPSM